MSKKFGKFATMSSRAVLFGILSVGLACDGGRSESHPRYDGPGQTVKIMTRNVHLGAEFDSSLNVSTPAQIPSIVASLWDQVEKSDFPGRARLIAQEVAAALPDIIAFQELEWFRMQSPSTFRAGAEPKAALTAPNGDMLAIMRDALAEAGLDYGEPVVVASHSDIELPGVDALGNTYDLRMTDRDAVFVRSGVVASNPRSENFAHMLTVPIGGLSSGISVKIIRGFAAVDLVVQGVPFTFINTHLEVGGSLAPLQESQARDLIERLAPISGQVVLTGDFNSAADGSTTSSIITLTRDFADIWSAVRPSDPGFTCCTDIRAAAPSPYERIDLILGRGKVRGESAFLTGLDGQHTPSGLLASDHLGVVATLTVGQ